MSVFCIIVFPVKYSMELYWFGWEWFGSFALFFALSGITEELRIFEFIRQYLIEVFLYLPFPPLGFHDTFAVKFNVFPLKELQTFLGTVTPSVLNYDACDWYGCRHFRFHNTVSYFHHCVIINLIWSLSYVRK